MTDLVKKLYEDAFTAKDLLKVNKISYDKAKELCMPYIDAWNKLAKEKAKKFKISPKKITFSSFIR